MNTYEKIYEIVRGIPRGRVMTYGGVAAASGNPRLCRVVGYALHRNPSPGEIPCHRVVNHEGRLAPSFAFGGDEVQRALLSAEGVEFLSDGRVDLDRYRYIPLMKR
ncbi:MAG: MGMT family protein [Clostridia bacterium]|nr:MGMT family protein [Clostridia bacterium]